VPRSLGHGCIIIAETPDSEGRNIKRRPLVVISEDADIAAGVSLKCVAITRQIPSEKPEVHVLLPWDRSGHRETGLKAKCAAHCRWHVPPIPQTAPIDVIGSTPPDTLKTIKQILQRLNADQSPSGEPKKQ
jgi:mRNA-degrading endonuclease toxin of MazEF toxin-antitoxin module